MAQETNFQEMACSISDRGEQEDIDLSRDMAHDGR